MEEPQIDNFYAHYGSVCHHILQEYALGELSKMSLVDTFLDRFGENDFDVMINPLYDKYCDFAIDYFSNIDLSFEDVDIVGVEQKVEWEYNGHQYIGYIDLLLRKKDTGELLIIDHKSAEYPLNKNQSIKKSQQSKFDLYTKQLYLYAYAIKQTMGEYPSLIGWNYFKARKWVWLPFDEQQCNDTIQWADRCISNIYNEEMFTATPQYFYCRNLCGYRNDCEFK